LFEPFQYTFDQLPDLPLMELVLFQMRISSALAFCHRLIRAQLVIEKELRKTMFLTPLTELAQSEFNTFYWLQILHKQADFWGGETYMVYRECHTA
jgi:hypothetical protein